MRRYATDSEKQALDRLEEALHKLDKHEQDRLLAFAEGMAFKAEQQSGKQ